MNNNLPRDDRALVEHVSDVLTKFIEFCSAQNKSQSNTLINLFNNKLIWWVLIGLMVITGCWFRWHAEILTDQINDIKHQINYKIAIQHSINESNTITRTLIVNQRIRCDAKPIPPDLQKIERNNSLIATITSATGTATTFSPKVHQRIKAFIQFVASIQDVCLLNKAQLDNKLTSQYLLLNELIDANIQQDYNLLIRLRKKSQIDEVLSEAAYDKK